MSSENLKAGDNYFFEWHGDEPPDEYLTATYEFSTPLKARQAALGIAREQSVCATHISAIEMPGDIASFCARVQTVETLPGPAPAVADPYFLDTTVYGSGPGPGSLHRFRATIAYPVRLFGNSLTRMWNNVFGEVHRLGFLSAVSLVDLQPPPSLACRWPGPRHGVAGLRERLGIGERPLFCRSMRPASGLANAEMLTLNQKTLEGGFDVIKDDELTYDTSRSPFRDRVHRMVALKQSVEDRTGEAKLYFANIIDDLDSALRMLDQASAAGVDGVLVSASVQGFSFITEVARRSDLMILAHNSCGDALTRAGCWGARDSVVACVQRAAGADLVVSPGPFATTWEHPEHNQAFLAACGRELGGLSQCLPIIQGGKRPADLERYIETVGSTDFMIIAATWLDQHPGGMEAGARAFRDAWCTLQAKGSS